MMSEQKVTNYSVPVIFEPPCIIAFCLQSGGVPPTPVVARNEENEYIYIYLSVRTTYILSPRPF